MERKRSREQESLRVRLEAWRRANGGRGRIPEEFWKEAMAVAAADGVWSTAKALRVNHQRLRKRMDGAANQAGHRCKAAAELVDGGDSRALGPQAGQGQQARFVSLEMGVLGGGAKTVIELANRRGDRIRVEV